MSSREAKISEAAGPFHIQAAYIVFLCRTWLLVSTVGDEGSGSDVDKVGVLGSSWGLEQSSSASDVISVRTTALGQVSLIAGTGLGNKKGKAALKKQETKTSITRSDSQR